MTDPATNAALGSKSLQYDSDATPLASNTTHQRHKKEDVKNQYDDFAPLPRNMAARAQFPPGCTVLICEYHNYERYPRRTLPNGALVANVRRGTVMEVGIQYAKKVENRKTLYRVEVKDCAIDACHDKTKVETYLEECLILDRGSPVWFSDPRTGAEMQAATIVGSEHLPLPLKMPELRKDYKDDTAVSYSIQLISGTCKVYHGVTADCITYKPPRKQDEYASDKAMGGKEEDNTKGEGTNVKVQEEVRMEDAHDEDKATGRKDDDSATKEDGTGIKANEGRGFPGHQVANAEDQAMESKQKDSTSKDQGTSSTVHQEMAAGALVSGESLDSQGQELTSPPGAPNSTEELEEGQVDEREDDAMEDQTFLPNTGNDEDLEKSASRKYSVSLSEDDQCTMAVEPTETQPVAVIATANLLQDKSESRGQALTSSRPRVASRDTYEAKNQKANSSSSDVPRGCEPQSRPSIGPPPVSTPRNASRQASPGTRTDGRNEEGCNGKPTARESPFSPTTATTGRRDSPRVKRPSTSTTTMPRKSSQMSSSCKTALSTQVAPTGGPTGTKRDGPSNQQDSPPAVLTGTSRANTAKNQNAGGPSKNRSGDLHAPRQACKRSAKAGESMSEQIPKKPKPSPKPSHYSPKSVADRIVPEADIAKAPQPPNLNSVGSHVHKNRPWELCMKELGRREEPRVADKKKKTVHANAAFSPEPVPGHKPQHENMNDKQRQGINNAEGNCSAPCTEQCIQQSHPQTSGDNRAASYSYQLRLPRSFGEAFLFETILGKDGNGCRELSQMFMCSLKRQRLEKGPAIKLEGNNKEGLHQCYKAIEVRLSKNVPSILRGYLLYGLTELNANWNNTHMPRGIVHTSNLHQNDNDGCYMTLIRRPNSWNEETFLREAREFHKHVEATPTRCRTRVHVVGRDSTFSQVPAHMFLSSRSFAGLQECRAKWHHHWSS